MAVWPFGYYMYSAQKTSVGTWKTDRRLKKKKVDGVKLNIVDQLIYNLEETKTILAMESGMRVRGVREYMASPRGQGSL